MKRYAIVLCGLILVGSCWAISAGEGVENENEVNAKIIARRLNLISSLPLDRPTLNEANRQGRIAASYKLPSTANPFIGTDGVGAYHWLNGYLGRLSEDNRPVKKD